MDNIELYLRKIMKHGFVHMTINYNYINFSTNKLIDFDLDKLQKWKIL